jgi:long-subunit acyl-CoA synthetase (AMP-forming)
VSSTTQATKAASFAAALVSTAQRYPDRVAVRTLDDSISLTWKELAEQVATFAAGLRELGVQKGDTVALMLSNRPEFYICDLAAVMLGATPFSIYQTLSGDQIDYILRDASPKVAVVERQYQERFEAARNRTGLVDRLVMLEDVPISGESNGAGNGAGNGSTEGKAEANGQGAVNGSGKELVFEELFKLAPPIDLEAAAAEIKPEEIVTLIYTSGTTGPFKGVQLTNKNVLTATTLAGDVMGLPDNSRMISWLPSAHIAERVAHYYVPVVFGMTVTCCPNSGTILRYLPQVKPNLFFGVPRIFEKLKHGLEAMVSTQPEEQKAMALGALNAAIQKVELEQAGQPVPEELKAAVAKADEELFSGLRAYLGFDQVDFIAVGAAPTPRDVIVFFHALGIEVAEIWGMSETTAIGAVNRKGNVKIGSVGQAFSGVDIKLDEDGEILLRSDVLMSGYRNMPEETAEAIDSDGWLHTGDIGTMDDEGFLTIIDRKKDLIINAAGKNISPSYIEGLIKSASPLVGQVCVVGDQRSYVTALILLDPEFGQAWAAQNGLEGLSFEELASNEKVNAAIQHGVDTANEKLARVEQVKRFKILPGEWQAGDIELTPTMKLRRKPIIEKYSAEIEALYGKQ